MIRFMKTRGLLVVAAAATALVVGVACSSGEAAVTPAPDGSGAPAGEAVELAPASAVAGSELYAALQRAQSGVSQSGIWVTGEGTIALEPDLALLNLGVEATAGTVAEARGEAASAMDAIVAALKAQGVEDRDIQTRFFNISPRYEYQEVLEEGFRRGKQVLVGYVVNNSASVKIRDLDSVGRVIDEVADAGGDVTRINGISFTVDDTKPFMVTLREQAVGDALARAQQFADLTGVTLGELLFITEATGGAPVISDFAEEAFAVRALAAPTTQISGGELELRVSVRAVFGIG